MKIKQMISKNENFNTLKLIIAEELNKSLMLVENKIKKL